MSFVICPPPCNHRHKQDSEQGAWVQFLVWELRFHMLHGMVKKKRKEPNYFSLQYLLSTYCVPGLGLEAAVIKAEMPYSMVGRGEERKRKDDFTWEKGSREPSRVVLGGDGIGNCDQGRPGPTAFPGGGDNGAKAPGTKFLFRFPGCWVFVQVELSSISGMRGYPGGPYPCCVSSRGAPKMNISKNQPFLSPNQLINGDFDLPLSHYLKTGEPSASRYSVEGV